MTAPSEHQFFFPRESAGSVLIEMMFNPAGYAIESPEELRPQGHGSAFTYKVDDRVFLVTARHNLTGRHWQTGERLGEWNASPTHLRVLWLAKPPGGKWPVAFDDISEANRPRTGSTQFLMQAAAIPLVGPELKPLWHEHPDLRGDMDVAVIELSNLSEDLLVVPWDGAANQAPDDSWLQLAPGQDLMVLGYPYKLTSGPRFPLWIRGSIASHPGMGHVIDDKTYPMFLIDARTRKGQSGSAVIRHRPDRSVIVMPDGNLRRTLFASSQLLGVYSGRTSDESDLGFVWTLEDVDVICREGVSGTGTF